MIGIPQGEEEEEFKMYKILVQDIPYQILPKFIVFDCNLLNSTIMHNIIISSRITKSKRLGKID